MSLGGQTQDPQPRISPRAALGMLLAINLFNYIDRYVLAAVLVRIGQEMLSGDPSQKAKQGWLATVFLISYMCLSPLFGVLGDRFSRWKLVGVGVILWSLASGASGLAGGYWLLLATRALVGVGEAAYGPVAPTLIADLFPVERRGRVMSWFYMAIPVGSALGYALGGLADAHLGWRWGFFLVVPPGLLLGILCFFMPEPPRSNGQKKQARAGLSDYLELLRTPSYVWNTIAMTALTFAIGGIATWMPEYLASPGKAGDLGRVNTIFGAVTVVTGITATLMGGLCGDAMRKRLRGAYFMVSAAALALAFPFLLLTFSSPYPLDWVWKHLSDSPLPHLLTVQFPLAWAWIFLAEFCLFFNTGPSNTALANVTRPQVRATAFAVNILMIHSLGDAISPPVIGWMADRAGGDLKPGFIIVGAIMLVGAGAWFIGARFLDRDTERVIQGT